MHEAWPEGGWELPLAGGRSLSLQRPLVMAILNATPDSFSDGGELTDQDAVRKRAQESLDAGASILDVGGESTRPGHEPVSVEEELARVVPVIETVREMGTDAVVSIDTRKATVASAALEAGADFINDVSALEDPNMASVAKRTGCAIVLMRNEDCTGDIINSTVRQLESIHERANASGLRDAQLVLDPGLGFGQRPGQDADDNLAIVERLATFSRWGRPLLVGASRKRFIGELTGVEEPAQRGEASAAIAALAIHNGAAIVRVHDVAETTAALARGSGFAGAA